MLIPSKKEQQLIANAVKEQQNSNVSVEKEKQKTEFSRYKQDCRKRALEMAHAEQMNLTTASRADKGGEVNVTKLADIYYNWLISIPKS